MFLLFPFEKIWNWHNSTRLFDLGETALIFTEKLFYQNCFGHLETTVTNHEPMEKMEECQDS